ncbi:hypothetical protein C8N32_108132 [Rhodovulum imhoffii]|uniref:PepSY domain-containing protein n=1 Tax=Rhodovulum imhoffii TaxID=365340 RepID=A0A2T5BS99_9RHOB|nr:PepSY domain-containing protein [Rhodovulum imhoffii]MBK5934756.1 hypothetical protein [Rhodovulum imhoffii]PTN02180.1 hypothetical protein C8N32_108132 [Rhodovulum imhoffii]
MTKSLMLVTLVLGLSTGAALAGDDCHVPMANWQAPQAVQQVAQQKGWTVRKLDIDDGCYEIKGHDSQGRGIEVKLDPATLEMVEFEFERKYDRANTAPAAPGANIPAPNVPMNQNGGQQ